MTVPYTFANQTGTIPLAQLDANFAAVPNYANTAATVTANAQPNITSIGTLTTLSVTGNTVTNLIFQKAPLISLGANAGFGSGTDTIAIGNSAAGSANNNQQNYAIAIGSQAGHNNQGSNAIAIGSQAGYNNQGAKSIAIGSFAGYPVTANNAVVINGSSTSLSAPNAGLYIAPIRNDNGNVTNTVYYNTTTKELTYSVIAGSDYGNANVAAYLPTYSGNLSAGNVLVTSSISAAGNLSSGNILVTSSISAAGNISGNYFIGDGSQLTGISAGNIIGSYSNANVAAYLPTYSGNVTANYFIGNGSQLTNLTAGTQILNGNSSINIASPGNNVVVTVGNTQSATFFGSGMSLSGNVTTGNLNSSNVISASTLNLKAANLVTVTQSLFRLASFSTTQAANLTPQTGDMIFNNTLGNVQIYTGTKWGNIVVS